MSEVVLFSELTAANNKRIAIAKLNSPKSLNALSLDMVSLLTPQLQKWHQDDDIAMVIIEGEGGKAFCAGGDVVDLYHACKRQGDGFAPEVENFFAAEYQLDYLIHTFNKPIMVWGNGFVMGGGLGLMAGASHKVATNSSRIAMPEITIGLYPDVGGSYFLNRMPAGYGLFLGLTAAWLNANDAKFVGLADHTINDESKATLYDSLLKVNWGNTAALNHQKLTDLLNNQQLIDEDSMPASNLHQHKELITALADCQSASAAVAMILDDKSSDKWMLKAQQTLAHGSALTAAIVFRQLELGQTLSLSQCFQLELGLSVQCSAIGEFAEGVRALLIDKDGQPSWKYQTIHDVDETHVDKMFSSPWTEQSHPLANLGK